MGRQMPQEMVKCIQDCQDCYGVCLSTMSYCLQKGGKHAKPGHIKLLRD